MCAPTDYRVWRLYLTCALCSIFFTGYSIPCHLSHRSSVNPTYIAITTLDIYKEQSEKAPVVVQIPEGSQVIVLDSRFGDWWMVRYREYMGYARSTYLKYHEENNKRAYHAVIDISELYHSETFFTICDDLEVREYATSTSAILTKLPKGLKVKVLQFGQSDWNLIYYKGLAGYLLSTCLSVTLPEEVKETLHSTYLVTTATSLRAAPDSQSRVRLRFKAGDEVTVLDDSGEWWWKVSIDGKTGWAKRRLLEKVERP